MERRSTIQLIYEDINHLRSSFILSFISTWNCLLQYLPYIFRENKGSALHLMKAQLKEIEVAICRDVQDQLALAHR